MPLEALTLWSGLIMAAAIDSRMFWQSCSLDGTVAEQYQLRFQKGELDSTPAACQDPEHRLLPPSGMRPAPPSTLVRVVPGGDKSMRSL